MGAIVPADECDTKTLKSDVVGKSQTGKKKEKNPPSRFHTYFATIFGGSSINNNSSNETRVADTEL